MLFSILTFFLSLVSNLSFLFGVPDCPSAFEPPTVRLVGGIATLSVRLNAPGLIQVTPLTHHLLISCEEIHSMLACLLASLLSKCF